MPALLPVPSAALRTAAHLVDAASAKWLGGKAKVPGYVIPERFEAQFRELKYTNAKAKALLGWHPKYSLSGAIDRIASKTSNRSIK